MFVKGILGKAVLLFSVVLAVPVFAAAGGPGGLVWTPAIAGAEPLSGVLWDGTGFVAVGDRGAVLTSPDGAAWTRTVSGTTGELRGAASDGEVLVVVAPDGLLLGRPAQAWSKVLPAAELAAITFAPRSQKGGLFVAVGARGAVFTSPDGRHWKDQASGTASDLRAVTWGGRKDSERFVAAGDGGTLLVSPDGKRWIEVRPSEGDLRGLAWGGLEEARRCVAVGQNGLVLQSEDGLSWTPVLSGTDRHLNAVAWAGSRFVAVGGSGTILTSPDGLAWSAEPSPTAAWLNGVTAAGGRIVAVGEAGAVVTADTYSISGAISKGGSQLAGVMVNYSGPSSGSVGPTAADGAYTIPGLSPGTYTLTPALAGNVFYPTSASVVLGTGNATQNFAAYDAVNITGTVYYSACSAQDVTITATSGIYVYTTTTTGSYTLPVQVNKTYTVVASSAGYTFTPVSQSVPVATSDVPNIVFTGSPHFSVKGTVTLGGLGLSGVTVTATSGSTVVGTATTASDGTYTIPSLTNGTYTLTPTRSGYRFSPTALSPTVNCADATGQDFTAEALYSIAGRVTLYQTATGIPGITLTATATAESAPPVTSYTATTDSGGNYAIQNVPNGGYTVTPSAASGGYTFIPTSSSVTVADANVTGIHFQAQATRHISGTVTYSDAPAGGIPSVTVTAAVPSLGSFTAQTASNGTYDVTVPPATGITVTPSLLNHTFTPPSRTADTSTSDQSGADFTAPHPPTFTVSGTVTTGGAAFPGVTITATSTAARSPEAVYTTTTGTDGKYTFQALNGSYTVVPSLGGHAFEPASRSVTVSGAAVSNVDFQEAFSISGTVTLSSAGLAGVTVTAGAKSATTASDGSYTITGLIPAAYTVTPALSGYAFTPATRSVTLTNASQSGVDFTAAALYKISGKVTLSGGTAGLADVTITGTGSLGTATTGSDGTYEFKSVAAGDYTLTPGKSGYTFSPATLAVTVTNADVKDKNFVATPSAGAPTVTLLNPTSGPEAGGTSVTVTGTNFDTAEGKTTVKFGTNSATEVKVSSTTSLTCKSPAGKAGQVDVTVTTSAGTSATGTASKFTYTAPALPTVTLLSPTSGPAVGGTSVTLTGTNFATSAEAGTTVKFGDTQATSVTVTSSTSLTAVSPAHVPGQVDVTVTTSAGTSAPGAGTKFTYLSSPAITSVSPPKGSTAGGESMAIVGSGFVAGATVSVGGAAATGVQVLNATTIQCLTPPHAAGQVDVKVTNADGQSATLSKAYTYATPPSISSVKKATDPFRLIITGAGFVSGCTVQIDNQPAPSTQFVSGTKVKAKGGGTLKDMVPKGVTKYITVVNPDGIKSAAVPYTR